MYVTFLITYYFYSFGFVEYSSVDEAKAVFDKQEEMVLDGRVLHINYSSRKIKQGKAATNRNDMINTGACLLCRWC